MQTAGAALEGVLRRDRVVVGVALALIVALAWAYILSLALSINTPAGDMDGMAGMGMAAPALEPWTPSYFGFIAAMWAVMMVGMMTPSVAPMVLLYARVGRQAAAQGKPFAATGWFIGGYLLSWVAFALVATMAQWMLEQAALLTPGMAGATATFGGAVLIAAGLYQVTPLKNACLTQCQSPLVFIQRHGGFQSDATGSLRLGVRHGIYCIGCCWALMALLFVGGVMNVLWIAGIMAIILLEKFVRRARWISATFAVLLVLAGTLLLVSSMGSAA